MWCACGSHFTVHRGPTSMRRRQSVLPRPHSSTRSISRCPTVRQATVLSTTEYQSNNNTDTGLGPNPGRAPSRVQIQIDLEDYRRASSNDAFLWRIANTISNNSSLRTNGCTRSCKHSKVHVRKAGLGPLPARRDTFLLVNVPRLRPLPHCRSRRSRNYRKHNCDARRRCIRLSPDPYPRCVHPAACTSSFRHLPTGLRSGLRSPVRTDKDRILANDRGTPRPVQRDLSLHSRGSLR